MNKIVQELRSLMHNTTTPSWANRAADEIERLEQQRDELLAAIFKYQKSAEECNTADGFGMWAAIQDWEDFSEAIAKAGG